MRALGFQFTRAAPVRRDPAPSRWAYRWQRLMLRPLFRRAFRVGLPVFAASLTVGLWLVNDGNRQAIAGTFAQIRDGIENRPEFMVAGLQVSGAQPALTQAIEGLVTVSFPVTSFDIDLVTLRDQVIALSAVQDATVAIRAGGMLDIAVTERRPVAVWRHTDGLRLIDAEGRMTGMILDRADRADLPLIAGDGAIEMIDEAMALFAAAAPISDRVRGLVRMGKRRWDIVLDRDQRILLPEEAPVAALEQVLALHQAQAMLDRDIQIVDMRDPDRPTLRLSQSAMNVLRNVTETAAAAGPMQGDDN